MTDPENRPPPASEFLRFAEGVAIVAMYTPEYGDVEAYDGRVCIGNIAAHKAMAESWRDRMLALGWSWSSLYGHWRWET